MVLSQGAAWQQPAMINLYLCMLEEARKWREKSESFLTRAAEVYAHQIHLPLPVCTCYALFLWPVAPLELFW